MKNTLLASAIALAGVFGFAGAASAQSQTEFIELEYEVPSMCVVSAPSFIGGLAQAPSDIGGGGVSVSGVVSQVSSLMIACTDATPYTIEADADVNGMLNLVGANTGNSIPVRLTQGPYDSTTAFGLQENGEMIEGVGTGQSQSVPFSVHFNDDGLGDPATRPMPAADLYGGGFSITLSY